MDMSESRRILVVDDEPRIVRFVRANLELAGYQVIEANSGSEALTKVRKEEPDLVVLDVAMPYMDGFETLARIREFSSVPVIMLTVRGEEEDRIRGLDLGADDYMTKPFSPRELESRIRAVLRRIAPERNEVRGRVTVDDYLSVDFDRREAIVGGKRIKLRPTENRLLYQLLKEAGWTVPHETLLSKVWGAEYRGDNQLLRLYINYLRKKIEPDPAHPRYILTERGLGYRFAESVDLQGDRS
ncbi:MAG TPA: response regulator transcription factor [Anaerolineae bacterium]|nr:response regulator transcription factor [Anaerolineae bacterium]